jgi:hypothetical protein
MTMPELVCSSDDPQWLAERRRGVTATDIPVILGLTSWNSPHGLWWDKTRPDPEPAPDTDRWRLGRELEPYIVQRWQESQPVTCLAPHARPNLYRSSVRPWQLATPDREVWTNPVSLDDLADSVVEVKSWAEADRHSWDDGPPPAVRAQVLWKMDVMNVTSGHVGVLFLPSGEFRHYTIEHAWHETLSEQANCGTCTCIVDMRTAGETFYRRMTGELPPPDVDGSAATLAALRARFAPAEGPAADIEPALWRSWLDFKDQRKAYEKAEKTLEAKIREQAGTADRYKVNGKIAGRRITCDAKVAEHVRHQDYIRPLANGSSDDDD